MIISPSLSSELTYCRCSQFEDALNVQVQYAGLVALQNVLDRAVACAIVVLAIVAILDKLVLLDVLFELLLAHKVIVFTITFVTSLAATSVWYGRTVLVLQFRQSLSQALSTDVVRADKHHGTLQAHALLHFLVWHIVIDGGKFWRTESEIKLIIYRPYLISSSLAHPRRMPLVDWPSSPVRWQAAMKLSCERF